MKSCVSCGANPQTKDSLICQTCLDWEYLDNERYWDKLKAAVANALLKNEKNRQEFLAMPMELQRGVILAMLDEGIIRFEIRAS